VFLVLYHRSPYCKPAAQPQTGQGEVMNLNDPVLGNPFLHVLVFLLVVVALVTAISGLLWLNVWMWS
jgi:hypothetical protein